MSDSIARNRKMWEGWAADYARRGRVRWSGEPTWGIWNVPETELGLLDSVGGRDVVELGCGTGYVSAWVARAGGRPVGIDPTAAQLQSALAFQHEFDVHFPLVCAAGEAVPLPDASFDVAISEYGASIWADPYRWIPEASRLLRPGGELIFIVNGTLLMLCVPDYEGLPAEDTLRRDYFGMHRLEWPDDDSVEFHLGFGDMIRLLRANGFEVEDLIEVQPGEGVPAGFDFVTTEWARRWPSEEIWRVRKRPRS